jgi:hypothetical protein
MHVFVISLMILLILIEQLALPVPVILGNIISLDLLEFRLKLWLWVGFFPGFCKLVCILDHFVFLKLF